MKEKNVTKPNSENLNIINTKSGSLSKIASILSLANSKLDDKRNDITKYEVLQPIMYEIIKNTLEKIPELNLYLGGGSTTSEGNCIDVNATKIHLYGYEMDAVKGLELKRALLGFTNFILAYIGTKDAYQQFVTGQEQVGKIKLEYGDDDDIFTEQSTFKGYHNFIKLVEEQDQNFLLTVIYAGLINDLGKTDIIKEVYEKETSEKVFDHDTTLSLVLNKFLEQKTLSSNEQVKFEILSTMPKEYQDCVLRVFSHPASFSQVQQCEATDKQFFYLVKSGDESLLFQFLMEYMLDVPGARPNRGNGPTQGSLTMNAKTMEDIQVLYNNTITSQVSRDAYNEYRNHIISILELDKHDIKYDSNDKVLLALITGGLRIDEKQKEKGISKAILEVYDNLHADIKDTLKLYADSQPFYIQNIVSLLQNCVFKIKYDKESNLSGFKKGLTIALYSLSQSISSYNNKLKEVYVGDIKYIYSNLLNQKDISKFNLTYLANALGPKGMSIDRFEQMYSKIEQLKYAKSKEKFLEYNNNISNDYLKLGINLTEHGAKTVETQLIEDTCKYEKVFKQSFENYTGKSINNLSVKDSASNNNIPKPKV